MKKLWIGLLGSVLALTGVACGDPQHGGGESRRVSALQAAAEAVDGATSSRMVMEMEMTFGGVGVTANMDGVFDFEEQVGEATMEFDTPVEAPGTGGTSRMVMDQTFVYVKGPAAELYGGTGRGWVRMDMSGMPGMGSQVNQDPSQYVEFLRAAADGVEEVGAEEIRGTPTTHYRADLTMDDVIEATQDENTRAYAEALQEMGSEIGEIPVDAWIGDDGLPRRIELSMSISDVPGAPDGEMKIDISVDLFEFGVPVDVRPPKNFEEVAPPAP